MSRAPVGLSGTNEKGRDSIPPLRLSLECWWLTGYAFSFIGSSIIERRAIVGRYSASCGTISKFG